MLFTVWDYAFLGIIIPLIAVLVLLIIVTAIGRKIANKNPGSFTYLIPILLWLAFTICGLVAFGEGLKYPASVLFRAKAPLQVTTGRIIDIYDAPSPPIYYNKSSHSLQSAKIVVVGNKAYYVLHTDAEVGEQVRLVWATEERVVYSLEVFTQEEAEAGLPDLQLPNKNDTEQGKSKTKVIGTVIQYISLFLFVCMIALQHPIGKKLAAVFQSKDERFVGKVVPNRYGLFYYLMAACPIFGVLVGFGLTGFRGIWFVTLIGGIAFFVILLLKQTTTLELQQDVLIYKKIGATQRICIKDIASVRWGRSSIPYNRRLIIKLKSGVLIDLEQEHYWGLENMYWKLGNKKDSGRLDS